MLRLCQPSPHRGLPLSRRLQRMMTTTQPLQIRWVITERAVHVVAVGADLGASGASIHPLAAPISVALGDRTAAMPVLG